MGAHYTNHPSTTCRTQHRARTARVSPTAIPTTAARIGDEGEFMPHEYTTHGGGVSRIANTIEHKARKALPTCLTAALRQAREGSGGRIPVVVLSEVRQGVKARRYVLLDFEDWLALGPGAAGSSIA